MSIIAKKWTKKYLPKRILAIRMQAMGDVVITLPYLQDLRNSLPENVEIDLLTRKETDPIPKNLDLFNNVFSIGGGRNSKAILFFTVLLFPKLLLRRYDIVIDLQNNNFSRIVRRTLKPAAWAEFDKTSPIPAGERTSNTIEAIGLIKSKAAEKLFLKKDLNVKRTLTDNGWDGKKELVVLNPAGVFETRNWPIENYVSFAKLWLKEFPRTQFVIIGLSFIAEKTERLKKELEEDIITIINKTNVAEAFAILQHTKFMLSEDSGLMHMSWVSGIPTFTLLGSTKPDRGQPQGEHTGFLDSSDMECGCCMLSKCKWGDTRCLTRYTPEFVFEKAKALISKFK
jgi:ADP-heptose:LPS heptosyltransferase